MADGGQDHRPGIAGLLGLIRQYGDALEADLLNSPGNLRLRDCPSDRFTWRDLLVFVRYASPDSHLYAAMHPDYAGWTKQTMLLALIGDELRWLHWAKTTAAHEGGMPPDPIPRPGHSPLPRRQGSKPKKPIRLDDKAKAAFDRDDPDKVKKLNAMFRRTG